MSAQHTNECPHAFFSTPLAQDCPCTPTHMFGCRFGCAPPAMPGGRWLVLLPFALYVPCTEAPLAHTRPSLGSWWKLGADEILSCLLSCEYRDNGRLPVPPPSPLPFAFPTLTAVPTQHCPPCPPGVCHQAPPHFPLAPLCGAPCFNVRQISTARISTVATYTSLQILLPPAICRHGRLPPCA